MDTDLQYQDPNIREIEDVIDIQKVKGSYNTRQVVFALPSDSESMSANETKSLESGLLDTKAKSKKRKLKKLQVKHQNGEVDVISWPSESDITVLRMKLLDKTDLKEHVANNITGDGLHQRDSSSMVNLATLMLQPQTPSKDSALEEYLIPLSSWEVEKNSGPKVSIITQQPNEISVFRSVTEEALAYLKSRNIPSEGLSSNQSEMLSGSPKKCKIARFLRLYFCPCCTCLYEIERLRATTSSDI